MQESFLTKTENFGIRPYQHSHSENISKWMSFDKRESFYISATMKYPVTQELFKKFRDSFDHEIGNRDFLEVYHLPSQKHVGHFELKDINMDYRIGTLAHVVLGDKDLRGKGLGKELCLLMADYGFNCRNLYRLGVSVPCCNRAAVSTYTQGGFTVEGVIRHVLEFEGDRLSLYQMGLLRPDWEKSKGS